MEKSEHLSEFANISKLIGQNPAYVQGGGGNTSVKFGGQYMAVKSSGLTLKEVTESNGYSVVDFEAISAYLVNPDEHEGLFVQKIRSFVVEANNRPSIETGFHALLGIYVIHTHSVYVNILTCSVEGREILVGLFPDYLWIEYKTPGKDLISEIRTTLKDSKTESGVLFLQNHGLIVWAKTASQAFKIHEDISNKIRGQINTTDFSLEKEADQVLDMKYAKILFPDQVIYTMGGEDILATQGAKETIYAYNYILSNIKKNFLTPNFLPTKESRILLEMESEKFRQKVVRDEIH